MLAHIFHTYGSEFVVGDAGVVMVSAVDVVSVPVAEVGVGVLSGVVLLVGVSDDAAVTLVEVVGSALEVCSPVVDKIEVVGVVGSTEVVGVFSVVNVRSVEVVSKEDVVCGSIVCSVVVI